jgi:hypothetical protein
MYRSKPEIADDKARGGAPVIHHSVAAKMVFGSENYAPITLPSTALVLMPDGGIHENHGCDRVAKVYKAQKMTVALQAATPDPRLVAKRFELRRLEFRQCRPSHFSKENRATAGPRSLPLKIFHRRKCLKRPKQALHSKRSWKPFMTSMRPEASPDPSIDGGSARAWRYP